MSIFDINNIYICMSEPIVSDKKINYTSDDRTTQI